MVGRRRGLRGAFSAAFPEKRIFIHTAGGTRYLRLGAGAQALMLALALGTGGLVAAGAARIAVDMIAADGTAGHGLVSQDAYEARLNALTAERDRRAVEASSAQSRFQTAMDQIGRQQTALLRSVEERRELANALETMRERLGRAVAQNEATAASNDHLLAQMNEVSDSLADGAGEADLQDTLKAVTGALSEAVVARDTASAEREALAGELAMAELELKVATRRQEEMIEHLQQAVVASFGPLEGILRKTELDVDSLLATLRQDYSGQGGPLVPVGVSTRSFPGAAAETSSFDELMIDIDRMNLLRIAVGKVPYAMPVKDAHRFTSGFGYRRDPKGGGRRMHAGVDFAGPKGTPIYASGDGVVAVSTRESGYGNVVRIDHSFGFETTYAHLSKLLVKPGQRVSRGDHIGDMGATGRVTGVHLHYEVRLNGRPVNPMTYVEAAKDVF